MRRNRSGIGSGAARRQRQSGMALVVILILMVPFSLIAATSVNRNILNEQMSTNHRHSTEALTSAEGGIEQAMVLLIAPGGADNGFDDELAAGLGLDNVLFAAPDRRFTTTIRDNDDGDGDPLRDADSYIILNSVGRRAGALREVEMIVTRVQMPSSYAITTRKALIISGNPMITGPNAKVHSNTSVSISGGPTIDGTVSSTGAVTVSSNSAILRGDPPTRSGADPINISEINPADYRAYADYVLTGDCKAVRASDGLLLGVATQSIKWNRWLCDSNQWEMSGGPSPPLNGFYYVQGNVAITSNPGTESAAPWRATIVAEGYIDASGRPRMEPNRNPLHPPGIQELLFVAGNDIRITGSPIGGSYTGIIATYMDIYISSSPTLAARIISNGETNQVNRSEQSVRSLISNSEIAGNPQINSNNRSPWDEFVPRKVAWRELID